MRTWRSHRNYVDNKGNPKLLSKTLGKQSLFSLLRAHGFRGIEQDATKYLIRSHAIQKVGKDKFLLIEPSSAKLAGLDETTFVHAAKCIDAFIGTLLFNLTTANHRNLLPEKKTEVLLPVKLHEEFRAFAQRQLTTVAHTIDDWLETKAAQRRSREKRYPAGAMFVGYSKAPKYASKERT
jgi:hypothetical protein